MFLPEKMKNLAVYDTEQIKREKMEPFSTWTPGNNILCRKRISLAIDHGQADRIIVFSKTPFLRFTSYPAKTLIS